VVDCRGAVLQDTEVRRCILVLVAVGCGKVASSSDGGIVDSAPDSSVVDASVDAAPVGPWTLIQTVTSGNAGTGSLTMPVPALGAKHLVVVAAQIENRGLVSTIADSSGCNTYVAVAMASATSVPLNVSLQLWYAKNTCAGATSISIAATEMVTAASIWEVAGIRTDNPLDTATVLNDQPASGTTVGPMITTSAVGEFVVSVALAQNAITNIHAGNEFVNDHITRGNGWGHLNDPHAAAGVHQAQWDQSPPGVACASAAAFRVGP
jgi:hypothetical protein